MNRVRLAITGLMHRLGFVPTELLDRAEQRLATRNNEYAALYTRNRRLTDQLNSAKAEVRHIRKELDEVYALRVNVGRFFDISTATRAEATDFASVLDVRVLPYQHSIRFHAMDQRLMRARPEDYARVWSKEIAKQIETRLVEPLMDALRRI